MPFLENVLRGKNVPRERMLEVAEHYHHFGGRSPINDHTRALIAALKQELDSHGPHLPVYWGNRNWHPFLADTLREMRQDGVQRALAFVTSAFGSYSGCRQYLEDIAAARQALGEGAPEIDKIRTFHNHPGFIQAMADYTRQALEQIPAERRKQTRVIFTAHSVPVSMAQSSPYVKQLEDACQLIEDAVGVQGVLAYQSRSGPPTQPWLEPDVLHVIRRYHEDLALTDVVLVPVGFLSDHMEVVYDLDTEAAALCKQLGMNMVRASTAGVHPALISGLRDLILERTDGAPRLFLGNMGASPDVCAADCCPRPARPVARPPAASA